MCYRFPLLYVFLLLTACAPTGSQPAVATTSHTSVGAQSLIPTGVRYIVDKSRSEVRIVTVPDGKLGHAHVIGGQVLSGQIVVPQDHHQVWFDLYIGVADLLVDDTEWRRDEGFDPEMTQRAINGTRDNMLSDKLLDAQQFPQIRIQANSAIGPWWQTDIQALITLVGTTREISVPVAVFETDNGIEIIGRMAILQTDFGIEPYAALGGILRVADKVLIRFRIRADEA